MKIKLLTFMVSTVFKCSPKLRMQHLKMYAFGETRMWTMHTVKLMCIKKPLSKQPR